MTTPVSRKMPMNSVASWTRLAFHKPQQKCIHRDSVPTDIFLTFDKTKYRENTIVKKMMNKTSYVTSVTVQFSIFSCYMSYM